MAEQKPQGEVIMMGKHERMPGWNGQIFVAIVKMSDGKTTKFEVLCDSTDAKDLDNLPELKIFENKMEALSYAMEMERNKPKWKQIKKESKVS
jgi:hypothetical protein